MEEQKLGRFKTSMVHENEAFQSDDLDKFETDNGNAPKVDPISAYKQEKSRKISLIHIAKEVLPRLENYTLSKTNSRPTLDELLGTAKNVESKNEPTESQKTTHHKHGIKLGWIQGVLIPCLLNLFGVMLFLRLSWVVAEAGTALSLIIVAISSAVCVITTLSLSAICTNGEVKGGGIYYIISRSLGPEFGASVGIVFAFANAVSASMNTLGFCNSLSDLLNMYDIKIIDGGINDARIVGTISIIVLIMICFVGMEWESKAQNFLIAIIGGAMVDFMVGVIMGPRTDDQKAQGFTGFNGSVWETNWYPEFRKSEGEEYTFFKVFAIFFPSVTGIQAGANSSGDLKDPASAIPKGTFLALLITMLSYALFMVLVGVAAIRDASGVVADIAIGNLTTCANDFSCQYGTFNSYQMMSIMSAWWPFIYAGTWAACLSTALTNLFAVPRLIQALGIDQIYPGLMFFSKGYGKTGEPYRGYIITFIVAEIFLLIGDLNVVAPLISNFYLASYALINFCTFHASFIKSIGWRPTFRYYNTWVSLIGCIACVVVMFFINWWSALITFVVILGLYLVVVYRKPDANWGSSTQAQTYKTALAAAQRLNTVGEHVKNYRPQILVLSGQPSFRAPLLDLANLITRNNSLLIAGDIIEEKLSPASRAQRSQDAYNFFKESKIKAFYTAVDDTDFVNGAKTLLQTSGVGKLSPNILLIGYKEDWYNCSKSKLNAYFNILHAAFNHNLSVAILRVKGGLDYSSIMEVAEIPANDSNNLTINQQTIPVGLSSGFADSNLNLSNIGINIRNNSLTEMSNNNNQDTITKLAIARKRKRKVTRVKVDLILNMTNDELCHIQKINRFREKQDRGFIDVWWLYDSGGLTMLLPYIISTRSNWSNCKLRVFALASSKSNIEIEERNMAQLLSKFRLHYSKLTMITADEKPKESTTELFKEIVEHHNTINSTDNKVSEAELDSNKEKTNRYLRIRDLLLENSTKSILVAMTLPMPRKDSISAPLYMCWLEILTKDMPPFLLIRGNQTSVLTFYS